MTYYGTIPPSRKEIEEKQKEIDDEIGHLPLVGNKHMSTTLQERYRNRRKRLFPHLHFRKETKEV